MQPTRWRALRSGAQAGIERSISAEASQRTGCFIRRFGDYLVGKRSFENYWHGSCRAALTQIKSLGNA